MRNPFKALKDWFNQPVSIESLYVPIPTVDTEKTTIKAVRVPNEPESTESCVKQALDALGDTYEKVAQKLVSLGIKGKKGQPNVCPVAMYLKQVCEADHIRVSFANTHDNTFGWSVSNPQAVRTFISHFDDGTAPNQKQLEA